MIVKILRWISEHSPPFVMRLLFNFYPPYLGAGIKVTKLSKDRRYLLVNHCLRFYNRNYVGTQFGGSIYSMTDPHYMYLIINILGPEYVVWDKAATIDFLKPGRTQLYAEFKIDDELIKTIKAKTATGEKYIFNLPAEVRDQQDQIIASVSKTIYVRKKQNKK